MSSYNQRKKREALRRLSHTKPRMEENNPLRRSSHQRALTDHDLHKKIPYSFSSPLERSEVQGSSSSSSSLPGQTTRSSSSLFGKPSASVFATSQREKSPTSTIPSVVFFGKESTSVDSKGVKSHPEGVFGPRSGGSSFGTTVPGSSFGKANFNSSDQDSASGVITLFGKPVLIPEPSSTSSTFPDAPVMEPLTSASRPVSNIKTLFGKPTAPSTAPADDGRGKPQTTGGLFGKGSRTAANSQPSSRKSESREKGFGSKRPLIEMEEDEGGREQDLSDLETFGASLRTYRETDDDSKKPVIRRRGLFGKALDDVQGKKKRRSDDQNEEGKRHRVSVSERQRTASSEEIKKITSIVCKDIPPALNLRGLLVDIFQEYGEVVKVSCQPESRAAIIYFVDHSSAARAKRKVKHLKRGTPPIAIYWASPQAKSSKPEKVKSTTNIPARSPIRSDAVKERVSVSPSRRTLTRREEPLVALTSPKKSSHKPSSSLQSLVGRIGHTASDCLEILEERDMLKREERSTKLGAMPALHGECEDMCPEKERYMREFQRRLSVYEVTNVGARELRVSHPAAVKEYSRSSADQELPLPSDLRAPPVLIMTMDYLMNNVMDKELREETHSWGEWYNFLWDRTRSIRKDITQQQLCDTTAVDLLEKCTRFHIFCAHHLCEEDLASFDPNINTENLTKCLQSLKHLYSDLAEKGVACENEAEFRAYDVLLNLNQGDILRQVQNYHDGVRNSEAIRFSVQCVSSISSQNYVKFFKLVKSASYLHGCVMHRYFTQVRNVALEIINKAFSTNRGSAYPVSEVMRLLAFETKEQTIVFCRAHGLNVFNGFVQLSRSEFFQPDFVIPLARSVSIIEEKKGSLIGEVVNGGPLPPNLRHHPSSSFDDKGRFTLTKIISSESGTTVIHDEKNDAIKESPQPIATVCPLPTQEEITKTGIDVAQKVTNEVIQEFVRTISEDVLDDLCHMNDISEKVADDVLEETTGPLVVEVGIEFLEDAREEDARRSELERLQQELIAAEKRQMREELSWEILNSIVEDVLQLEARCLVSMEKSHFEEEQRVEQLNRIARDLGQDCLDAAVMTLSKQISMEVYEEELRIRDEALAEIEGMVHQLRQSRYLKIWRKAFAKKLRLKDTIETFPAGPSINDIGDQLREFSCLTKAKGVMSEITSAQSIYDQQQDIAISILRHHRERYLSSKALWSPLDLPAIIGKDLIDAQGQSDHLLWKLVISVPSVCESEEFALFSSWFKSKMTRGYIPDKMKRTSLEDGVEIETCSLYNSKLDNGRSVLSICTKVISGTLPGASRDHLANKLIREALIGTRALVMVLDIQGCHGNDKLYWNEQSKRLLRLLNSKPKYPGVPLLIYAIGEDSPTSWKTRCQSSLNLTSLWSEGFVSDVHFTSFSGSLRQTDLIDRVTDDLKWLANSCPISPSLESTSIAEYLDIGLTNFFSLKIRENENQRRNAKIREESFDAVVCLYNAVIQHLIHCCSGSQLKTLSWPPAEFKNIELPPVEWNDPSTLADLRKLFTSLMLPDMGESQSDSWADTKDHCLMYIKSLPGSPHEKVALISRVQWLLRRCQREFEAICGDNYLIRGCSPRYDVLPWTSLAEACVDYMMSLVKTTKEEDEDGVRERIVFYFQADLDNFRPPEKWLRSASRTLGEAVTKPDSINESYLVSVEERQFEINIETEKREQEREDDISGFEEQSFINLPGNILSEREMNVSGRKLRDMLALEKDESQRFDDYLKSILQDPPLVLPSFIGRENRFDSYIPSTQPLDGEMLLEDRIKRLEDELDSSRRASRMDELRLETFIAL